jgi:hypothetical protein
MSASTLPREHELHHPDSTPRPFTTVALDLRECEPSPLLSPPTMPYEDSMFTHVEIDYAHRPSMQQLTAKARSLSAA